jgi:hypothetical protein
MRFHTLPLLALLLLVAASPAWAQQRRPAQRQQQQAAEQESVAAPGPNVVFRMRMFEVMPDKWPEVARQFNMKSSQRVLSAVYSKQMAAAIQGMQKQQMIHLMSEPEISTVSGYPASLSIGGDEPAEDEPLEESKAVRTAHEAEEPTTGAGYTLEVLPKVNGGRIRLEMTYGEGATLPEADAEGRRAPGKGGAKMALEMRNGQTVSLVMAPAGKQSSPKIMLITAEVQNPAPAPAAARRPTRTR